jgi:hypothetical protein
MKERDQWSYFLNLIKDLNENHMSRQNFIKKWALLQKRFDVKVKDIK